MALLDNKNIFVIEDDATNLAIVSSILRRNGATLVYDRWGLQTITKMTRLAHIDLILLDLMLPNDISGYDVYAEIQTQSVLKDIPVVVVSASDPNLEMAKAKSLGIKGFISKPIHRKTFPKYLARILNGEEVWDADLDIAEFDD